MDAGEHAGSVLVVSEDLDLIEQLLRLCAAAGATPGVVSGTTAARRSWRRAAGVLVGADLAESVAEARMPRRDGVVLVSTDPTSPGLWQLALALRADSVAVVPKDATELVGRLGDLLDGGVSLGRIVGVVAARGGAGATTLTAALALTAARNGVSALLVDGDSLAGGIDLVVGCEDVGGLRWPEVAGSSGRVSSSALRGALPTFDDLCVLSWDRGPAPGVDAETMRSIVAAGQRGCRFVAIDLPRRFDEGGAEAATCCDLIVVVCPADVRAVAGAARMLPLLREVALDIRLVVRTGGMSAASAVAITDVLEIPLLGTVPTKARIARSIDAGLGIPPRGPLAGACGHLLRELGVLGARL